MTRTRDLLNGAHAGVRWARGRLESMVLSATVWLGTPGVGSASTPKDSKLPCRQDRPVPSARALQRQMTPSGGRSGPSPCPSSPARGRSDWRPPHAGWQRHCPAQRAPSQETRT